MPVLCESAFGKVRDLIRRHEAAMRTSFRRQQARTSTQLTDSRWAAKCHRARLFGKNSFQAAGIVHGFVQPFHIYATQILAELQPTTTNTAGQHPENRILPSIVQIRQATLAHQQQIHLRQDALRLRRAATGQLRIHETIFDIPPPTLYTAQLFYKDTS